MQWVYDFDRNNLIKKVEFLSKEYNKSIIEVEAKHSYKMESFLKESFFKKEFVYI